MKRAQGLHFASAFLLISHFTFISSSAQTSLFRTLNSDTANIGGSARESESSRSTSTDSSPTPIEAPPAPRSAPTMPASLAPSALKVTDPRKFGPIDIAYLDAFTILSNDNSCSRFFGGRYAVSALTELVLNLKPRFIDQNIAIRMSGDVTTFQSHATGFSFRMFKKVEVNLGGSFFRNNGRGSVTTIFPGNSRETRVVVLLHELGHLVKNSSKQWVLPDDGDSNALSLANTDKVITVCRQEIDSLSKVSVAEELEMVLPSKLAEATPR